MAGVISVLSSEEEAEEESLDEWNFSDSSFVSARTSLSSSSLSSNPYDAMSFRSDFSSGRHIGSGEIEEIPDCRYFPFTPSRRFPAPGTAPTNNSGGLHSEAPPRVQNVNRNAREWKDRKRMGSLWLFSSKEIRKATNNFDEKQLIGGDGSGFDKVYKGRMPGFQHPVAIKVPKNDGRHENSMIDEILILSRIRHKNITKPIGVCSDKEVLYFVYEFYPNGTLQENLFNGHMLWEMRLKVATEVAGALAYLQSSLDVPIVHRDIKPDCIYLDANYIAKICNFPMARSVPSDQTHISTCICGTAGYLDPEYLTTGRLTCKSDVYSFGVFLMVLLTRQQLYYSLKEGEEKSLLSLFISSMEGGTLEGILDVAVANADTLDEMRLVARLAAKCLERRSEHRPTIQKVSMALEQIRIAGSSRSDLEQRNILNDDLYSEYMNSAHVSTSHVKNSTIGVFSKLLRWTQNRQKKKLHSLMTKFLKDRDGTKDILERHKIYTIHELKIATNNFDASHVLSKGKNIVYKGILVDGTCCAIKKPTDCYTAEEILKEINFLSQLSHKYIVGLLGFCFEEKYPMSIHEYMTNGPLSWKIQDKSISWESCLQISSQIAEVLSYLHTSLSSPIIHGDVKCSNILLDDNNVAKISDFGSASILRIDDNNCMHCHGTFGYIDPEYLHTGRISCKSDVYGFGVVLAQLITGETAIFKEDGVGYVSLAERFTQLMDKNIWRQYIDEIIAGTAFIGQMKVVADLVLKCLSSTGEERPSMKDVAMKLQRLQRGIQ